MYRLYSTLTLLATPVISLLLKRRLARGKEDASRFAERWGYASLDRPSGKLVWIHAASVGESMAVLPLIDALLASPYPPHVLLTTGTVTSARLMQERLPARAIHQFAPVDGYAAVKRFLLHWQPDVGLWVDSEFWPNLIMQAKKRDVVLGVINARMSEQSYRRWRFAQPLIRELLSSFHFCYAQTAADGERLNMLGMRVVDCAGNLKYDAAPLPYKQEELMRLQGDIGTRPVWLAASTHPGEEEIMAEVHAQLKKALPDVLTIIIPRHANRGDAIAEELLHLKLARRSKRQLIKPSTELYLADTMGELGLFYRLARISFIGGSLVEHGGQNPLEPARLGSAIILGPHTENFTDICAGLELARGCMRVSNATSLAEAVKKLLASPDQAAELTERARAHVAAQSGQVARIMNELQPYLALR